MISCILENLRLLMRGMLKNFRKYIFNIITYPNYFFLRKTFRHVIFSHVPQSGGNSVDFFFKLNFGFRHKKINTEDKILDHKCYDNFLLIFGHFGLDRVNQYIKDDSFKMFSIRNPKNRYLSNYFRNKKLHQIFNDNNNNFMELVDFLRLRISQGQDNLYTRYLSGRPIYDENNYKLSQRDYDEALKNIYKFDFIFLTDKSKLCFKLLSQKLKIKFLISKFFTLHKNKVSGSVFRELSFDENNLLDKLTNFDQKIYDKLINIYNDK